MGQVRRRCPHCMCQLLGELCNIIEEPCFRLAVRATSGVPHNPEAPEGACNFLRQFPRDRRPYLGSKAEGAHQSHSFHIRAHQSLSS